MTRPRQTARGLGFEQELIESLLEIPEPVEAGVAPRRCDGDRKPEAEPTGWSARRVCLGPGRRRRLYLADLVTAVRHVREQEVVHPVRRVHGTRHRRNYCVARCVPELDTPTLKKCVRRLTKLHPSTDC